MKKKNILEITVKKKINVSKDVIRWNYWDHDHLDEVHGGYEESNILFEKNDVVFRVDTLKIPFIPFFKPITPVFMVKKIKILCKLLLFNMVFYQKQQY